ncbi:MAG TPA: ABC transporter ATP-binding protein [Chitinophagaceae bacterium]
MEKLLRINNLAVDFISGEERSVALQDVSLEVKPGEIVAIVGESGSGKSVTALSVLQLIPAPPAVYKTGSIVAWTASGETELLKAPRNRLYKIRGKEIAMIFQEPMTSLNPVMRCGHQVTEAILAHENIGAAAAKARTLQLFKQVKLPDPERVYRSYPHQLSGGQKQRVMIAMAMSCKPELLICDEPTTALDVTVQKSILSLIRELQQESGMGVIFITHDLGVVAEVADRVIVMYRGSIVEENRTTDIFNNPEHPYTRALLACRPARHRKGERLPVVSDFMQTPDAAQPAAHKPAVITESDVPALKQQVLVKVEHLKVWFPTRRNFIGKTLAYTRAVDDVSFEVYRGETLGLVGESGCGKSTLGRAILQLLNVTSGHVIYDGREITGADTTVLKQLRRKMQIVFQDPYSSLHPRMTIGDAIAEPLKVHGIAASRQQRRQEVIGLLEKVGLKAEHYNRYPHEFSGGQRQRIVIARALSMKPEFIVCDESVSALDVSVQAQVLNLLNDLKKEFGLTLIFISHDLSVIRYVSDRIVVMNKGKIEETGTAEEIYQRPRSPYTQKLLAAIPRLHD